MLYEVITMTDTFILEGIDHEAVIHEKNMTTKHLDEDRHWWPQCEALEGLANRITSYNVCYTKLLRNNFFPSP